MAATRKKAHRRHDLRTPRTWGRLRSFSASSRAEPRAFWGSAMPSFGRCQSLSPLLAVGLACVTLTAETHAQGKAKVEIVPQIAHSLGVVSVAFSADGARVLSGSYDKTVKLWDAATGAQLRTFEGHGDRVTSVAFSPDGTKVLSGSEDKTLKLWDAATGSLLRTFEGDANGVNSVAFSPDGTRVLSGGWDGKLKLWDAATGALLRTFEGQEPISSVAFSPDGALLLSGSMMWGTTKLWDAATGAQLRTFEEHTSDVTSVAFSPDGTKVLSGSEDKTLKLWDAATGAQLRIFEGHTGDVTSVAFSPDGASVLSGSRDKTMKLWDAATGALLRTFNGHTNWVNSVAFSPDGARVLSGSGVMDKRLKRLGVSDDTVKLWATSTGQLLRTFEGHASEVLSVVFSPDGTRVLSGGWDKTTKAWDADTGRLLRTFEGHVSAVTSVAFSPDGASVLSDSTYDMTMKQWDAATGSLLRTLKRPSGLVSLTAFSPDGARVASGSEDKTVKLWDATTRALLHTCEGHTGAVKSVAFSPDGARVASGSEDKTVKLWDAANGQLIRTFEGHADTVNVVAFSADGTRLLSGSGQPPSSLTKDALLEALASAKEPESRAIAVKKFAEARRAQHGADETMKLWDAATGALLRTFDGHSGPIYSVAFSPDGAHVLSFSNKLQLWDTSTGQLIRTFEASNKVLAVAFSPDGARLLTGSSDNTIKLWDAATGALLRSFEGHLGAVTSIAFSPDGTRVLSGSWDRTVRIWSVQTGELLVTMIGEADGEWLAITPKGFFAASRRGTAMLGVVRGLEPFSVMQFYDHLYRPDLIEQVLKGDPEGKYADAASKLNLEKILNSGSAPQIEQVPERKTELINDTANVTVRLTDTGGGIGEKVVWRVNGVTQGELSGSEQQAPKAAGGYRIVTQSLRIDPAKKNVVEITAYNGAGLLASEPYGIEIDKFGVTSEERPRMYVVAVGVTDYAKAEWHLKYAANDAQTMGNTLKSVARGLYGEPKVISLLDKDATAKGIEAAIDSLQSPRSSRRTCSYSMSLVTGAALPGHIISCRKTSNSKAGRQS